MSREKITKRNVLVGVVIFEIIGFIMAIFVCWVTEALDPPFTISQVLIETTVITVLGGITVYFSLIMIKRIQYLEGFLSICASCKKVKTGEEWIPIESVIGGKSELIFSHGICPECAKRLYGVDVD